MQEDKEGGLRLMTLGEIALAKSVFGEKISYNKVWIHHDSYLPFGLQHERVAMTPNGEIYYRTALYRDDFSVESMYAKHTFIHELSHVWQRERGVCVICRGLVSWLASYRYVLDGRLLSEYPMEQQAQIIADSYALKNYGYLIWRELKKNKVVTLDDSLDESSLQKNYANVLRGFSW